MRNIVVNIAFLVSIGIGFLFLIRGISDPWVGMGDSDGALFGSIARNYIQFGLFELKFGQLTTFEEINQPSGSYYLHHPPLYPMLVSIMYYLFGESEVSVRSVSIIATLSTSLILFFFVTKAENIRLGILAVFFFMTYPSTIFFGRKPGYEALTLFFIILTVSLYQNYKYNPRKSTLIYLCISLIAGAASDWAAYFLPIAIIIDHILTKNNRCLDWNLIVGICVAPVIVLMLFIFSIYLVDKNSLLDLLHQGLSYMGFISPDNAIAKTVIEARITFSMKEYFFRLANNFDTAFGMITIMLSLFGIVFLNKNQSIKESVIVMLFVTISPLVIFWRSLYFHIWWLHLLSIPLAILSAMAIDNIIILVEKNAINHAEKNRRGIIFATCFPILITMTFNYNKLSNWQERLLPYGHHEKPSFIKEVGHKIYNSTTIGGQILTNLEKSNMILPYYSRRKIYSNITSPDEIEKNTPSKNQNSNSEIYFLLYFGANKNPKEKILYDWLNQHVLETIFNVDENKFYLFKLNKKF